MTGTTKRNMEKQRLKKINRKMKVTEAPIAEE